MMFLEQILDPVLELFANSGVQTTVVLALAVAVVYFRKALGLGSLLSDWVGKLVFSLVILIFLLLTGIVPGLDVAAAMSLVDRGFDLGRTVLSSIL